jgi:hypothetical protein
MDPVLFIVREGGGGGMEIKTAVRDGFFEGGILKGWKATRFEKRTEDTYSLGRENYDGFRFGGYEWCYCTFFPYCFPYSPLYMPAGAIAPSPNFAQCFYTSVVINGWVFRGAAQSEVASKRGGPKCDPNFQHLYHHNLWVIY